MAGNACSIAVRVADEADAPAVAALLADAAADDPGTVGSASDGITCQPEAVAGLIRTMREFSAGTLLVAFSGAKPVGALSLWRKPRGDVFELGILVKRERRGAKIGTELLRCAIALIERQPGARVLELEVRTDNLRAIGLYEKFGFVGTGRRVSTDFADGQPRTVTTMRLTVRKKCVCDPARAGAIRKIL